MLLILGLDGATLDLVEPWVADGTMPHLGRLMHQGAWGRLASTVPAATFPGWTTFMTGVNPGRHGIFDFTRRDPGTYRVRFINASYRKAPSIWRLLSQAGRRVAVLGLPGTYPPETVNGCMVSGFDTPVTTRADRSFVYPPELAAGIERSGGFPFADFQEFDIGPGWHAKALQSLLSGIEKKTRLSEQLLSRAGWDCFMLLMGESDTVAHHFWGFHDPRSPRHDAREAATLGSAIRKVYRALDTVLGRLLACQPGARVLVVSDHGFGGAGDTVIYLNRWLAEQGFLAWQQHRVSAALAGGLRRAAVRMIPERWQARCFRIANGRVANTIETRVRFGGIDWHATRAFAEELNYFPAIWLNVRGRDPMGQVAPENYAQVCQELTDRLLQWRDPARSTPVVRRVWRRDEVYQGPYVELAPDLILDLETPGNYSYVCLPSYGPSGPSIERLNGAARVSGKLRGMSGSHRPDGLVVLAGEGITPGVISGASIADMAPTILSLCGVSVPAGWDGRPLACTDGAAPGMVVGAGRENEIEPSDEDAYDATEEECLRQRLARLGYLD